MFCTTECDYYVDLSEELITSVGTETCKECRKLIHVGTPHYHVREWAYTEDCWSYDEIEVEKGIQVVCEECGDLALSLLDKGFCWSYGDLRDCINELHSEGIF